MKPINNLENTAEKTSTAEQEIHKKINNNTKWARRFLGTFVLGEFLMASPAIYGILNPIESRPKISETHNYTELMQRQKNQEQSKHNLVKLGVYPFIVGAIGTHYNLSRKGMRHFHDLGEKTIDPKRILKY